LWEYHVEVILGVNQETSFSVFELQLGDSSGSEDISTVRGLDADGGDCGICQGTGAFHGSAKKLGEGPILGRKRLYGKTSITAVVLLGGVALEFMAGWGPGDRIAWEERLVSL
jgi:hypothetical protein